ncbi:MAG TPA: KGK domain-containing protein [Candidatus Obscuribacterales bacterium]
MEKNFESLDDQEIFCFEWESLGRHLNIQSHNLNQCTFKNEQFANIIIQRVQLNNDAKNELFFEGTDCEVLRLGAKKWEKGKARIKITVEFCPDEPELEETPETNQPEANQPESPLDDIRRMINQENQQGNS